METKIFIEQIDWIDKEGHEAEVCFNINGKKYWAHAPVYSQRVLKRWQS
jgi:hypothetical protein